MKKIIFTLLAGALLAAGPALAQAKFNVGAQAGVNMANLSVDDTYQAGARFGYQYGLFVRYGGQGFLQFEGNFLRFTSRLEEQFGDRSKGTLGVNAIQFPLLGGFKLIRNDENNSAFRIMAGPVLTSLLSVRDNDLNLSKNDLKRAQIDGQVGLGLDLSVLSVDLRYQRGFRPVLEDATPSQINMVLLTVGVRL